MRPKKQPLKLSYGSEHGCCKNGSVWTRGDRGDGAAGGDDGEPAEPTEAGCLTKRSRRRRCRSRCELPLSSSSAAAAAAAPLESADIDEDGEGTDEASETASGDDETHCRHPDSVTEIKERMYLVKLASLKSQLSQLEQGVHPEYIRRLEQLQQQHKDRIHFASVWLQYECELIESECERDLCRLQSELQQRRVELRNSLIGELEHKRRQLDTERANMDINGDTIDVKQLPTRKLRRRANDPAPVQDKRRKCGGVAPPVFVLDDQLIDEDLLSISRNKPPPPPPSTSSANTTAHHHQHQQQQQQQQQHHFRKSCFMPDSPMASFAMTTTTATVSATASAAPSLPQSSTTATVTTVAHLSSSPIASPCSVSTVSTAVAATSSGVSSGATSAPTSGATGYVTNDVRIEDNKLFFERKWFHRGQPVFVEMSANDPSSSTFTNAASSAAADGGGGGGGGSNGGGSGSDGGDASQMSRYGAVITAIQAGVVWVRRTSDNTKTRISLDQLQHNQCSIKRRAS